MVELLKILNFLGVSIKIVFCIDIAIILIYALIFLLVSMYNSFKNNKSEE